jgi:hypothetical protein
MCHPSAARLSSWRAACLLVLFMAAHHSLADTTTADCHALADRDERLACYDRVTGRPAGPNVSEILGETVTPPAPGASPPAQPAAADTRVASAPAELSERGRRERAVADEPLMEAVIIDVHTTSIGRRQFMLDNGELWEQVEVRKVDLRQGDRVDVRPSALGTWQMRKSDGRSRSTIVRRAN